MIRPNETARFHLIGSPRNHTEKPANTRSGDDFLDGLQLRRRIDRVTEEYAPVRKNLPFNLEIAHAYLSLIAQMGNANRTHRFVAECTR